MKTKFGNLFLLLAAACLSATGQVVVPDLSPFSTITQRVGFNDVTIEYSRPSARGRMIFGELVPYGEMWRLGANASTKIFFREEMTIEDKHKLGPGIYGLYAIPTKGEWEIIFSREPWLWGSFKYKESYEALRIKVKAEQLKDPVETFTIQFANVCSSCAEIQFAWEFTRAGFRISTNADEKAVSDIKKFTSNPEGRMAGEYYLSAKYYLDTNRDLPQALTWIDKALAIAPDAYWMMHTKAEIQAKMGDYRAAIETAGKSRDLAKAKNDETYIKMNEQEIDKWKSARRTHAN